MSFDMFHFTAKSYENKEKPRQKPWFFGKLHRFRYPSFRNGFNTFSLK